MKTWAVPFLSGFVFAGFACQAVPVADEGRADIEVFQMSDAPNLPFSSAVRAGDILFLSGQIGNIPGTLDLAEGGVAAETRQTLENIRSVVEFAGSSVDRIVKCTVFLLDINDYAEVNSVYAEFFGDNPPARSALAGSGLAIGASVEIECIAMAGAG